MMASRLKIWEVNDVLFHYTRLWCACFHYLASALPHFHTSWRRQIDLMCQNQFGSHGKNSHSAGQQWCRFLLWNDWGCLPQHWILPYYSWAAGRPVSQSATSTCFDPLRCCGISHQRLGSGESRPACWWQWIWAHCRSSYRGRSWRWMYSSWSVTLSLVSQSQYCLLKGCKHFCCSKTGNRNGRYSELKWKKKKKNLQ